MSNIVVYVEGGGDTRSNQAPLKRSLKEFILNALPEAKRPAARRSVTVEAVGGGEKTFHMFEWAVRKKPSQLSVLLVDAENEVTTNRCDHLRSRGHWPIPGAEEDQCHLMVVAMETWLVADPEALQQFYGTKFNAKHLPGHPDLEVLEKQHVNRALAAATAGCKRDQYTKAHGMLLLGRVDPAKVERRAPHCRLFLDTLRAWL